MNKSKYTIKVNNYINIEYDTNNIDIVHIWYVSKYHAYDCLYDTKEQHFFAYSTLLDFLTNTQKSLIKSKIKEIKKCYK